MRNDDTLKTGKIVEQLNFKKQRKHITKLLKVLVFFMSFGMFYRFIARAGHFRKWSPRKSARGKESN